MLLAEQSTEVAQQNEDGRPAKQFMCVEDPAVDRHEVEVEIDPHRIMMRPGEHQSGNSIEDLRKIVETPRDFPDTPMSVHNILLAGEEGFEPSTF